jgi:hypothetical protein
MQMLNEALAMSPAAREAFEKEERARLRDAERMDAKGAGAEERMAKAEDKRAKRRQRNLLHCS